ncbi:MAG: hypothetical protein ACFFCZ_27365 [Promethearchaeota archaeon]
MITNQKDLTEQNNKIKRFFKYWESLDKIKILPVDEFDKLNQEVRGAICDVLATGTDDVYPGTNEILKRHVLSANEIKDLVEKKLEREIKKNNLYFHLQELMKLNVIRIVDALKTKGGRGKKYSAYYGRTAKMFLIGGPKEKKELNLLFEKEFLNLLKRLNPEISINELKQVINDIGTIRQNDFTYFVSWLKTHESILDDLNIDFRDLFSLVNLLKIHDSKIFQGIINLSKLLRFDS